jgi:hypothetical protein
MFWRTSSLDLHPSTLTMGATGVSESLISNKVHSVILQKAAILTVNLKSHIFGDISIAYMGNLCIMSVVCSKGIRLCEKYFYDIWTCFFFFWQRSGSE